MRTHVRADSGVRNNWDNPVDELPRGSEVGEGIYTAQSWAASEVMNLSCDALDGPAIGHEWCNIFLEVGFLDRGQPEPGGGRRLGQGYTLLNRN